MNSQLFQLKTQSASSVVEHKRVCNLCEAMCGIKVIFDQNKKDQGQNLKIKPDTSDPFSKGSMCPKAFALGAIYSDPDRLHYPLKKVDENWQEISWPEAYELVETQVKSLIKKYGRQSIASYLGNPNVHNLGMMLYIKPFLKAIGSKNVYSATSMDQLPHHFACHYMFGHQMRIPVPDVDRTEHMIVMGANPLASNGSIMSSAGLKTKLREINKKGGKLVVIDPRKTETAKIASEYHAIIPGTDLYLLLSFLHIMFRDGKVNLGALKTHVSNFNELETLFTEFSPDHISSIVGIAEEKIEIMVTEFLQQDKAVLYGRMGLSTQKHGGLCNWLIYLINLLSDNFDKQGGMMFPSPAIDLVQGPQRQVFGRWKSRIKGFKEFGGELPVVTLIDEMKTEGEGQIKALFTLCGNPVLSSPSGHRLDEALTGLDFMVSIDNYINETTRHADLILPTPMGLEVDHYDLVFNHFSVSNHAKYSEALFAVAEDRPYDWQVLKELTQRISTKKMSYWQKKSTPQKLLNWGLMLGPYGKLSHPKRWLSGLSLNKVKRSENGVSLGPLKRGVPEKLNTDDKKIDLAPEVFVSHLNLVRDDEYKSLKNQRLNRKSNEFLLIGRRLMNSNNSWLHQVETLSHSKQVRCTVLMNPADALSLKLKDEQKVKVVSKVGHIVLPLELNNDMMPGVISIPHGFGHNKKGTRLSVANKVQGASINDLTDPELFDQLTGNAVLSGFQVCVEAS